MKVKHIIWFLLFLLILTTLSTYIYSKYTFKPDFIRIENLKYFPTEDYNAEIKGNAVFHYPGTYTAELLNIEIKVYSNDVHISTLLQDGQVKINPDSEFSVPFKFEMDLLRAGLSRTLSGLMDLALSDEKALDLRFSGYCRIKTSFNTFKIPIESTERINFN